MRHRFPQRLPFAGKELDSSLTLGVLSKQDDDKYQWHAEILIVNKKEDELAKLEDAHRMCPDSRKLNFITCKTPTRCTE